MQKPILSVVPRSYLPFLAGGLEITARDTADAISQAGRSVTVAAATPSAGFGAKLRRRLFGPYPIHHVVGRHVARFDPWHGAALPALIERLGPGAAVCHVSYSAEVITALAQAKVPTLFYVHSFEIEDALRVAAEDDRHVFAAESRFVADRLSAAVGRSVEIIRPVLDPAQFAAEGPKGRVLAINPHPLKGGAVILEVARRLPHRSFLVAGRWANTADDPEAMAIERALSALPNVERQHFIADMRTAYAQARCLLMPCIVEEAFGRAAAEACIAGVPIVASARGALPETAGEGGIILPHDAASDRWADAVERLFADEAHHRAMSDAAQRQSREESRQPAYVRRQFADILARLERRG